MGWVRIGFRRVRTPALVFLCATGCLHLESCTSQDELAEPDLQITEVEPNDDVQTAQIIGLAEVNSVRVLGTIADEDDLDLYDLGSLPAGDRVTVDVTTSQTELDAAIVIFDTDSDKMIGTLMAANDDESLEPVNIDPFLDQVIRHRADHYIVGVAAWYGTSQASGAYDLTVRVKRSGLAPQPRGQTVLLDFDGGTTPTRGGQTVVVAPFDAASVDAAYVGQTQVITSALVATVTENFAGFNVDILNTDEDAPPSDRPFSTVFIGEAAAGGAIAGSEGLGAVLNGTDTCNEDPTDNALVFVDNFGPANFGFLEPISPQELGVAIGNVASHEIGHLLGLNHVFDPSSVMNTFDAPTTLLLDQRFKRSLIHFTIFDPLSLFLTQDARLLLEETVGRVARVANTTSAVGQTPLSLTAGDLDGDGDTDLAVANRYSNDVSILLNDGGATLAQAVSVDLGAGPTFVTAFDADGDDDLDLLTANPASQSLILLRNDGQAGFSPAGGITAGDGPFSLDTADFDGDGELDVAAVNFTSNDVSILLNDGGGSFHNAATHLVGQAPGNVTVGDFNGDTWPDLVAMNFQTDNISVLLNHGDGTFADAVHLTAGLLPGGATAADLDGDGDVDLAVANRLASLFGVQFISNVSVLMNKGDGSFETPVAYFVGGSADAVASADLDGDGDVDLAVACGGDLAVPQHTGQLSVLLNRGDGTFAQDVVYETGSAPVAITVADLNADAAEDLVLANSLSNDVSVFLNTGDGRFGAEVNVGGE